jgi:hypothetical protein
MSKVRMGFALLAGATLAALVPTPSGDAKAATPDEIRAGYVEDIASAHELADFAAKYKSPEAYVAAAGLLLKVDAQTKGKMGTPPKEVTVIGADMKEKKEEVKGANLKAQAKLWFEDARGLATDAKLSKEVESLIKAAEKRDYQDPADKGVADRGKAGGPANVGRTIPPNQTHVYHWKFQGGELAAIGMSAGGPLGIKVVGPNGGDLFGLVGGRAIYRWAPKKTDEFVIRIHNGSKQPVTYNLISN